MTTFSVPEKSKLCDFTRNSLKLVEDVTSALILSEEQLQTLSSLFSEQFTCGLSKQHNVGSSLKMFPTHVSSLPKGTESGKYMAIVVDGHYFRIALVELKNGDFRIECDSFDMTIEVTTGSGELFFQHIISCLAFFQKKRNIAEKLPLGLAFCFPCKHEGLSSGRLVEWSKEYKCPGIRGQDVVQLFTKTMKRREDVMVGNIALLNDTTANLLACAFRHKDVAVGLIVGTGTNACYIEKIENVQLWKGDRKERKHMIINTEWGSLGNKNTLAFLRTQFDEELDKLSLFPGKHLLEKMVGGMYLGELVRQIVITCTAKGYMLKGCLSDKLQIPFAFQTDHMLITEKDTAPDYKLTKSVFEEMDFFGATEEDCKVLQLICSRLLTRAALLVSVGLSTLLNKLKRPHTTIGVGGHLYRLYSSVREIVQSKTREMTNSEFDFQLVLIEDGDLKGAALLASMIPLTEIQIVKPKPHMP